MPTLHFDPVLFVVRGYADGEPERSYAERKPFDLLFSCFIQGDEAHIFGGHGHINLDILHEACHALADRGVRALVLERHGSLHRYRLNAEGMLTREH